MKLMSYSSNMRWSLRSCFRHRTAVASSLIGLSLIILTLILYKLEEIHTYQHGIQDLENHNSEAAILLRDGVVNGKGPKAILRRGQLTHGQEGYELLKESRIINVIRANISHHDDLAKANNALIGDGSKKKYLTRADVRKALEQRTKNGKVKLTCQIPDLDPFDEFIKHHIIEPEPLHCQGTMVTDLYENLIFIKESVAKKMKYTHCYASTIHRENDYISQMSSPVKINFKQKNPKGDIPMQNITNDFTLVVCVNSTNVVKDMADISSPRDMILLYDQYPESFDVHASVVPKLEVKERSRTIKPPSDSLGLNVIMLGLEATSRMNFIRQLPETYQLLGSLDTLIFEGYNIVADATTGALIPLLTGKTELELPEVRKGEVNSDYVDANYPLIWKEFADNGYATMFAEDSPGIATFNLRLNGFLKQPTDHYMRNLWNGVKVKNHCLGSKPVHRVMLDYLMDYMTTYKDIPHFGFSFLVGLTHANINPLKLMDADLYSFLADAKFNGLLNNTILLIFGDHGSRYSQIRQSLQGKLEERLPFFSVTLPDWVSHQYPDLYKNLVRNTRRLMTPFDVHETLKSVLHYRVKPGTVKQRGISIFNEIPKERTCTDAAIDTHWCSCLTWEPANIEQTNQLAQVLVDIINKKTLKVRDTCAKLRLSVVLRAEKMVPNQKVLRFKKTDEQDHRDASFSDESTVNITELPIVFQVTVQTLPGKALFEGTIRVLPQSKKGVLAYDSEGAISRINKYGDQADCIRNTIPHLMKFCYCRGKVGQKLQK